MFSLPWFEAVALAQANNPPSVSQLAQYRADTGVVIPFGTAVPQGVDVLFGGSVADVDGDTVRLEVELQQLPGTFTGVATHVSDFVTSGSVAQTPAATGLAPGNYGWRARAVDSGAAASDWALEGNPDFKVSQGLPDLVFDAASANPQVVFKTFTSASCEVAEGCAQPGLRTLLRFNAETRNIGSADLVMGDPAGNPLFYFDTPIRVKPAPAVKFAAAGAPGPRSRSTASSQPSGSTQRTGR